MQRVAAIPGQTPEEHWSNSQADLMSDRVASRTDVDWTNMSGPTVVR